MLQEDVFIVWVEERLDSIWTVDSGNENVLCGIRKKLWTTVFCTSKLILICEASANGISTKVSMLEEDVVIVWARRIPFERVAMETYVGKNSFAESEWYLNERFNHCSSSFFE